MNDDDKTKTDDVVEETKEEEKEEETPAEVKAEDEAEEKTDTVEEEKEEEVVEASPAEEPEATKPEADVPAEDKANSNEPTLAGVDQQGRQLYNVKCSNCGKDTQVPFKPSGDRPVYCRDCYMQKKNS